MTLNRDCVRQLITGIISHHADATLTGLATTHEGITCKWEAAPHIKGVVGWNPDSEYWWIHCSYDLPGGWWSGPRPMSSKNPETANDIAGALTHVIAETRHHITESKA